MRLTRKRRQEPSRRRGLRMARRSDDLEGLGARTFYQGRGLSCLALATFAGFVGLSVWLISSGGTEVDRGDMALLLVCIPGGILLSALTIGALISPAYLSLDELGFTSYSFISGVATGRWTECGPFHLQGGQNPVWCDPRRLDPPEDWRARFYRRRHSKRFRIPQAMADLRGASGLISHTELERILNNYQAFYGQAADAATDYGTPSSEARRQD
jgi:hypothetical protein